MPKYLHTILVQDYHIILTMTLASLCIPVTVWTLLKYFVNKICGCHESKDFIWFVYRWVSNAENGTWHIVGAR